jgi:hypothetical protein
MRLRADRKESRKKEAAVRQEEWNKLTPEKKLKELDLRLGANTGAKKQRAKLAK